MLVRGEISHFVYTKIFKCMDMKLGTSVLYTTKFFQSTYIKYCSGSKEHNNKHLHSLTSRISIIFSFVSMTRVSSFSVLLAFFLGLARGPIGTKHRVVPRARFVTTAPMSSRLLITPPLAVGQGKEGGCRVDKGHKKARHEHSREGKGGFEMKKADKWNNG